MPCFSFFLIKIDCANSNAITVDTEIMVKVMNNAQQVAKLSGKNLISGINTITFNNSGTVICGDIIFNQQNNTEAIIVNKFTSEQISQINTNIVNSVTDQLTQSQTQGLLNFLNNLAGTTEYNNSADVTNKVKESVSNAVSQIDINDLWTGVNVTNDLTINNTGTIEGKDQCLFVQGNYLNVRITNIVNALQTSLQNDQFLNQILTYAQQSDDQGTFGLKWIIYAVIALAVIGLIGTLLYLIFSPKSSSTSSSSSSAETKLKGEIEMIQQSNLPQSKKIALEKSAISQSDLPFSEREALLTQV